MKRFVGSGGDLIENIHNPPAQQDGRVVEIVHEAVKHHAELTQLERAVLLQYRQYN